MCSSQTGELVRIMGGDDLSSTDLHFACNGSLLVGEVAELTQVDPTDAMAASRLHHRNLQVSTCPRAGSSESPPRVGTQSEHPEWAPPGERVASAAVQCP